MAVATQRRKKAVEKKQFTYSWSGIDRYNEKAKGEIVADSPQHAKQLLIEQQVKVKKVAKKLEFGNFKKKCLDKLPGSHVFYSSNGDHDAIGCTSCSVF